MSKLDRKERELVAIGASVACNCVPCITYHVREAKAAGVTDEQLKEAIDLAEKVKKVSADKVRKAAFVSIDGAATSGDDDASPCAEVSAGSTPCGCKE